MPPKLLPPSLVSFGDLRWRVQIAVTCFRFCHLSLPASSLVSFGDLVADLGIWEEGASAHCCHFVSQTLVSETRLLSCFVISNGGMRNLSLLPTSSACVSRLLWVSILFPDSVVLSGFYTVAFFQIPRHDWLLVDGSDGQDALCSQLPA